MKFCEHCGEKLEDNQAFCTKCGKKVKKGENKPKEETKTDKKVESTTSKQTLEPKKKEGLGTASMVIGIISLVLSFVINILVIPLAIVGLILGIVNKAQKGKKISGIILNIVAIVLSIIVFIVALFILAVSIGNTDEQHNTIERIKDEINKQLTEDDIDGTWKCKSYRGTEYSIKLELDDDNNTFKCGLKDSFDKNYTKGNYTIESNQNATNTNMKSYRISMTSNEEYENGSKKEPIENTKYTFTIRKYNDGRMFGSLIDKNYTGYTCYED